MGNEHSKLQKMETAFRNHESISKIQVMSKSTLYAKDFRILYADTQEVILEARFRLRSSKDNWITLIKSPATLSRQAISTEDIFSTIGFSDRKRPIQLSIGGRELILAARDSFTGRKAYSHKCVTRDNTWFTWSKHSSDWFCFAGDLMNIEEQRPIVRIDPSTWSLKRLMDIEMSSEIMQDNQLMLEILIVGIAITAKETVPQESGYGGGCSIM